jgi:hypothetical protein
MNRERIWIFALNKELGSDQLVVLNSRCIAFINGWTAHEQKLSASYELYGNAMLIFKVNEALYNASGCSIDKLTHFVQGLEKEFAVELLNRMNVVYEKEGKPVVVHVSKISGLIVDGTIHAGTLVFENTISLSDQFSHWKKPLKDTWLSKYLPVHL